MNIKQFRAKLYNAMWNKKNSPALDKIIMKVMKKTARELTLGEYDELNRAIDTIEYIFDVDHIQAESDIYTAQIEDWYAKFGERAYAEYSRATDASPYADMEKNADSSLQQFWRQNLAQSLFLILKKSNRSTT